MENMILNKKEGFKTIWAKRLDSTLSVFKILFRNKLTGFAVIFIFMLVLVAIFAPRLAPYPEEGEGWINLSNVLQAPSWEHPFGTDDMGRDILSRMIYGARISLAVSTVTILVAMIVALPIGLISGYYGGVIDEIMMRVTDIFLSFPTLLIAILIASFLGQGIDKACIAIAIAWWTWYARVVRAQTIAIKERPYIKASQCIGTSKWYIMFRHILPNTRAPVIIQASMDMGSVVITCASLSFIGLGAQIPTPEWGLIISSSRKFILDAWWFSTIPGLVILFTVLSFNLLGDGLREVLDPRTRMR